MTVVKADFIVELEIGSQLFELTFFQASWGINSIPSAVCAVPLGRNARDGKTPAKIHSADEFKSSDVAKVYFEAFGKWAENQDWPKGRFLLFEGRVVNRGFQKIMGKVQFVIHLVHWLADLNYSSSLSSQSHPANPTQYTFQSVISPLMDSNNVQPYAMGQTAESKLITFNGIQDDLWGKALKPLLCGLAANKHIQLKADLKECLSLADGNNGQALAALKRIEGEAPTCNRARSAWTPKLSMNLDGMSAIPTTVASAISTAIRRESIESFVHSTLWGKLVDTYSSAFMFSVIPLVDTAVVVPYTPGLQSLYCKKIAANDYNSVEMSGSVDRPIRGVAVYGGKEMSSGLGSTGSGSAVKQVGVGGCFTPSEAKPEDGMIYVIGAPAWLANVTEAGHSPGKTTGLRKRLARPTGTTPQTAHNQELRGNKDNKTREQIIQSATKMYDNFAHAVYVREALRGRIGMIGGKLRFDICPGSNILIEGSAEQFLEGKDKLAVSMIGSVNRVTIAMNCESAVARTSFQLEHLRTEKENESDKTSVAGHPLYTTIFKGAPLISELLFPDKGQTCES